ncbi:MAG: ABC transporter ATP-binding protein [Terriglobales bacterium]
MLEVRALERSYGGVLAVRGVNFTLRPGEICGYLGPNGSGKTTTIRMLTGLLAPTRGAIYYDGSDVADDLRSYKARLGYVPEEAQIYTHLTGNEYLELVGGLRGLAGATVKERARGLLDAFAFGPSRHALISSYSKGMKQKVLIAAALLHDPEILILDEPLSGLDVTSVLLVRNLMQALARRGKIVLFSSHMLESVERAAERVIVLYRGLVVADDTVAHLGALSAQPSLEGIFAQLTSQPDLEGAADDLARLLSGAGPSAAPPRVPLGRAPDREPHTPPPGTRLNSQH